MGEMQTQYAEKSDHGFILPLLRPLKVLNSTQIAVIDRMLDEIGPFGEIRLIKRKGVLRFIERVESEEAP